MRAIRYSPGDEVWHWGQVAVFGLLLLAGAAVHWPGAIPGLGLERAVVVHDAAAVVLLGLLTYGVLRSLVRRHVAHPRSRDLLTLALRLAAPPAGEHPLEERGRAPMSTFHREFYRYALGVVLPVQVMSGVLMLVMRRAPRLPAGNLVAALHATSAFVVVAFIVVHVYATTLRADPRASLRAMVLPGRGEARRGPAAAAETDSGDTALPIPGK